MKEISLLPREIQNNIFKYLGINQRLYIFPSVLTKWEVYEYGGAYKILDVAIKDPKIDLKSIIPHLKNKHGLQGDKALTVILKNESVKALKVANKEWNLCLEEDWNNGGMNPGCLESSRRYFLTYPYESDNIWDDVRFIKDERIRSYNYEYAVPEPEPLEGTFGLLAHVSPIDMKVIYECNKSNLHFKLRDLDIIKVSTYCIPNFPKSYYEREAEINNTSNPEIIKWIMDLILEEKIHVVARDLDGDLEWGNEKKEYILFPFNRYLYRVNYAEIVELNFITTWFYLLKERGLMKNVISS